MNEASNILVKNKRFYSGPGIYIGRPSPLGNPFSHLENTLAKFKVSSRKEAVSSYEEWIISKLYEHDSNNPQLIAFKKLQQTMQPFNLICWCAPSSCHGDILKKLLDEGFLT